MRQLLHLQIPSRRLALSQRLKSKISDWKLAITIGRYRSPTLPAALRGGIRLLPALLLLTLSVTAASAKSLAEYHLQLRESITALDTMSQHDESESETDRAARVGQTLAAVRAALPEADNVETGGVTIAVNNSWLHRELETYDPYEGEVLVWQR